MPTRTKIIVLSIVIAAGAGATWLLVHPSPAPDPFDRAHNELPRGTRKVLNAGERIVLLSLDPTQEALRRESDPSPKETFHGYVVLGQTEIRDEKERTELLHALYKGIADSDGLAAACFNPRHGISATLGNETVDLVICFECMHIQTHAKDGKNVRTTRSPEPIFARALERAHLPIANETTHP